MRKSVKLKGGVRGRRERGRSENEERSEIGEVRKWRERCKIERVGVEREREKKGVRRE